MRPEALPVLCALLILTASLVWRLNMALAQEAGSAVVATWEMDNPPEQGWRVGDLISLRLKTTYSSQIDVTLAELPEQWGAFEVREQTQLAPVANEDGTSSVLREVGVTLWSVGEHETPPYTIRYRDEADNLREVVVPPLSVKVVSVLTEGDQDKRDLKRQASLPRPQVWPWFVAGTLVSVVLFLAVRSLLRRLRWRRRNELGQREPLDDRLPEVIAYDELDRIAGLDLPAQGEFKRHYTLVTDCVRTYVEGVTAIPAMDRTTSELMTAVLRLWVDGEPITLLRTLLDEANLVKFAKLHPSIGDCRAAASSARRFVDLTKPDRTVGESPDLSSVSRAGAAAPSR